MGDFVRWYVRIPPADFGAETAATHQWLVHFRDVKSPYVRVDSELPPWMRTWFWSHENAQKDPTALLELFVACVQSDVYPPREALEKVAGALDRWLDKEGVDTTIDKELGLVRGKGSTPAYKERLQQRRDWALLHDVGLLVALGATQEQACEMVARRLEVTGAFNDSRWEIPLLNDGTLLRKFQSMSSREREARAREVKRAPPEAIRAFLATFPLDAAPDFMAAERKSAISDPGVATG
jgi:hypothetical protein